jgi:hypothetical protein
MKPYALVLPILWIAISSGCKPSARQTGGGTLEDSLHVATAEDSLFKANRPVAIPVETPPWKAETDVKPSAVLLDLETPMARDTVAPLVDRAQRSLRPPAEPKPRS